MTDDRLLAALREIAARGSIGEPSLTAAVAHADRFVRHMPEDDDATVVDLGSGGGLPGLVIAWRRPALQVVLTERRRSRADQLRRAARALGLSAVVIVDGDVRRYARDHAQSCSAVTARSFAAPELVVPVVARLLAHGGIGVISEPPGSEAINRWSSELLSTWELRDEGSEDGVRLLRRG